MQTGVSRKLLHVYMYVYYTMKVLAPLHSKLLVKEVVQYIWIMSDALELNCL